MLYWSLGLLFILEFYLRFNTLLIMMLLYWGLMGLITLLLNFYMRLITLQIMILFCWSLVMLVSL